MESKAMAIRVRCDHCRKKISMDEAFAGGVCRCPYCGQLNMAPGAPGSPGPDRRPDRPDAPGAVVSTEAAVAGEAIPVARPVLIQGVVALALIGLLLATIIGGVTWYVLRVTDQAPAAPQPTNPLAEKGPRILAADLTPPVVYVVDGSSGTGGILLDVARLCVWRSAHSLGDQNEFNLLLVRAEGTGKLAEQWIRGGKAGYERAREFLADGAAHGSTDLDAAVAQAIELGPKSVVVLAGKAPKAPAALAAKASGAGIIVHCISLGAYGDVTESMRQLAEHTGGRCQPYQDFEIIQWHERAPPLP